MTKPDRVVVFIDYQNTYRAARDVYHDHAVDPHWLGQTNPQLLGEHLAQDSPYNRQLHQVRVYRGLPSSERDRKGYSACRKQLAAWSQLTNVTAVTRPLQYPAGWPENCLLGEKPSEKGIDVQLALDMAVMAHRKEYEVAILMSLDTDLRPALELVSDMTRAWGKPRIEVGAWSMPGQLNRRLSLTGGHTVYCHWIDEPTYKTVQDNTSYS
ncbi:NYN domain-containing protein [Mycobacteroides chelonae]|nr:NYN domain-containing protein [Mycobacteroides chelonae]MBF9519606.1 NYN domain-containing protein [Mycobacteroides chelonae]SKN19298.1 NYN domain [Mycobacteroides abscessus subsp. bolletii]